MKSRKEKPPRTALRPMSVGSGGNPLGAGVIIILAILIVAVCIIGLLNSMK